MQRLYREQHLPINADEAWSFFSNPANLNEITPPDMLFEVTSPLPDSIYEGLIITYRIRPLMRIPMNWCTEITHMREGRFFVDEQRSGPYRIWHHEHHFEPVTGGVCMKDLLHYDIGMSVLGAMAGKLFVHRKVREIFDYRYEALRQRFGALL